MTYPRTDERGMAYRLIPLNYWETRWRHWSIEFGMSFGAWWPQEWSLHFGLGPFYGCIGWERDYDY